MAEGLSLLRSHAEAMDEAASSLESAGRNRGARVLRALAGEEAGKFLVLVDAVRCNRAVFPREFGRQLKRFAKHLPRGIQAAVCEMRPASYGELIGYIDTYLRPEYYLDGPNDVDWIFRNRIQADREEAFYVDLVERDDGSRQWVAPDDLIAGWSPGALQVVSALSRIGAASAAGLERIADVWRDFVPDSDASYADLTVAIELTIRGLADIGLAESRPEDGALLVDLWPFPLYRADIDEPLEVDPAGLVGQQQHWLGTMIGH